MSPQKILEEGKTYSFRSFFEMSYGIEEILAEFGVSFQIAKLALPRADVDASITEPLKKDLEESLDVVVLASEMARREILVAPVLVKAVKLSKSQVRIEHPLIADQQLKGKLDYLVRGKHNLLVVEAKNDDMARGFTQLSVEMIALSRRDPSLKTVYGAVTIGDVWRFGILEVEESRVTQNRSLYRVPEDTHDVMSILVGILAGT